MGELLISVLAFFDHLSQDVVDRIPEIFTGMIGVGSALQCRGQFIFREIHAGHTSNATRMNVLMPNL